MFDVRCWAFAILLLASGLHAADTATAPSELKALLAETIKQARHRDVTKSLAIALSYGFGKDADVQQLFREVALGQHAGGVADALHILAMTMTDLAERTTLFEAVAEKGGKDASRLAQELIEAQSALNKGVQ